MLMDQIIFDDPGYNVDETQSQDGRGGAELEGEEQEDIEHDSNYFIDSDHVMYGPGTEGQQVDIEHDPLFVDELTQQVSAQKRRGGQSIRTKAFTKLEDKFLCKAWETIGQDPRTGVEQKGAIFWTRIHTFFQEHKMYPL